MEFCLITDIGGTNSRLFLYEMDRNDLNSRRLIHEQRYVTIEHTAIYQVIDKFLAEEPCRLNVPTYCSIAIAGAVKNNTVPQIANFKWDPVDGEAIAQRYNLQSCKLLNDFEAAGYSFMTESFSNSMITLQAISNDKESNKDKGTEGKADRWVLAGFGTGLGVVSIVGASRRETFRVLPSEGGHIGLAPANLEEWELIQYLMQRLGIKEHELFSQEFLFCGRGIPLIYDFIKSKTSGKVENVHLTSKQVFDEIVKEGQEQIKGTFLHLLCGFLGRSFDHLGKLYLPTGGKLIVGGIIYHLFVKFFNADPAKFMESLSPALHSDPEFGEIFRRNVEILLYTNDTEDFVVEGAINHLFASQFMGKAKPKRSSLKDNYMKPITSASDAKVERKVQINDSQNIEKRVMEKKVSFDMPTRAKAFEDFYFSNMLKANVMTFTGYLNLQSVKSKLFIGKIVSDSVEKFYRRKAAWQEFRGYRLRLLDAEVTLIIPLNIPRLFINDIILLNDHDTLYYSKENGWYFQTFDNTLTDIKVGIFDTICEKYIGELPLVDTEKIASKTKFQFTPTSMYPPKPEVDIVNLLFTKSNGVIQSRVIMMRIVENLGHAVFRRDKETILEFTHVRIQAYKYTFDAYIPKWTNIPQIPFYGFFFKETYLAPGCVSTPIFVIDEYSIFDRSPLYDDHFVQEVEKNLTPSDLKVQPFIPNHHNHRQ